MPRWYREVLTQEADPDLRAEIGHYLESRRPRSRKLDAGCVVEFMKKGRLCCGAVWPNAANGRMQFIIDADASQTWIRRSRLLDISSVKVSIRGRRQAAAALDLIDERRRRQAAQLDMETLWALAAESKAPTGWTTNFLTDLAFGDRRGGDSRAVLLRVLHAGEWFSRRGDRWVPHDATIVDRRRQLARDRQRQSGELDVLAGWLRAVADGDTERRLPEGHQRAIALLEEAALGTPKGHPETRAAAELMARAHLHGAAAAFDLLVRLGRWSTHENLEIHRGRVPIHFTADTLTAAQDIHDSGRHRWMPPADRCSRAWSRPLGWVPAGSMGCERAFSARQTLRGFKVTVFLAAPVLLFERDSTIEQEAAVRGRSISPPDRDIPMLPPSVVEDARLVDDEGRPAVAITVVMDRSFTLKSVEVGLRRVRPRLVSAGDEPRAQRQHSLLSSIATSLRDGRLERSCIPDADVRRPAVRLIDGQPSFPEPAFTEGMTIDEELTHLACWAAAAWCRERDIPTVYRTQAAPESPDIDFKVPTLPSRVRYEQLCRLLPRPSVQTDAAEQSVLGFLEYASTGMPCSRFEDLMMQRQLISAATGQSSTYSKEELEVGLADTASAREVAYRVERSGQRYWTLMALEASAGDRLPGLVIERAGLGYRVLLEESGFSAFVPAPGELWAQPGDRIVVRVAQVSAHRDLLKLADPQRPTN